MEFKKIELRDYTLTTYESGFVKDVLELLVHEPELRRFSMNLRKAWKKLALLDELEIVTNVLIQENSRYPTLPDFIQLIIHKADHSLQILGRKRRYRHDFYTPRRKIFNKLRKDLTLIKLNEYLIELIMALWIMKQKRGGDCFSDYWTSDFLKEYWNLLGNRCPAFFCKSIVSTSLSKDKETTMKRMKKIAI